MNSRLRKLLLPLLKAVKEGKAPTFRMRSAASQALFLIGKGTQKPSQGRLRRVSRRSTKNEETEKIREAVFKRAAGRCEAGGCENPPDHLDHWLSGAGRRRQRQSVATTWALCRWCHQSRTENFPSVSIWNDDFAEHCLKYGYSFIPHVVHEPIRRAAP